MLCVVGGVSPDGSAGEAGIQEDDIIREFAGVNVASTEHFIGLVAERAGLPTPIVVERAGDLLRLEVTPRHNPEMGRALIGVSVSSGLQGNVMPWMQYRRPLEQVKGDAMGIVRILRALLTPREARQAAKGLGGPIMIFAALWVSIKISFLNAIGFLRFLNVNLAILNLLPIPVLDGGHVVFSVWEGVTRRKVHPRVANALINFCAVLLIGALVLLSFRDVLRVPKLLEAFRSRPEAVEEDGANAGKDTDNEAAQDTPDPGR
jgi:regulator of sigma E protease